MKPDKQFSIIPAGDELSALQRDLRFFPTTNSRHESLSVEQIDQYNRLGYVTGITIFSPEEMQQQRAYFDRLLEAALARGDDSYSISSAHLTYPGVYDILTHPKIVSCTHSWFYPELPPDYRVFDSSANVLVSPDPEHSDPATGTTELRGLLCKIYKAAGPPEGVADPNEGGI